MIICWPFCNWQECGYSSKVNKTGSMDNPPPPPRKKKRKKEESTSLLEDLWPWYTTAEILCPISKLVGFHLGECNINNSLLIHIFRCLVSNKILTNLHPANSPPCQKKKRLKKNSKNKKTVYLHRNENNTKWRLLS